MLARVKWVPQVRVIQKKKKISKEKKTFITGRIAAVLKAGEPTYFAFEGSCRTGVRLALVKQGWNWSEADTIAAEVVAIALHIIGAKRPTWYQGQPAWTEECAIPIKRERCKRCHSPLPEDHWIFCSRECASFYHEEKSRERIRSERMAANIAMETAA